jgi:hypothetical protein
MSTQLAVVLVLLAAAIVMFAINRPRMDVRVLMLTLLPFTGRVSMSGAGRLRMPTSSSSRAVRDRRRPGAPAWPDDSATG